MTIPSEHIHITEREADGTWEDCTWCSGLEWYRLVYNTKTPATHAEMQALRAASGEPTTGGSNIGDLKRGIKARYGKSTNAALTSFSALKSALTPGRAAVVQGSMKAFGPTHRLSKWDTSFDGGHAVLVMNLDGTLYWCDPEAPTGAAVPVTISWAELQSFVNAFPGAQHLVSPIKSLIPPPPPAGADMPTLTTYTPGATANIKALSNVRADPAGTATKLRTVPAGTKEAVVLTGTVKGTVDPANGSDVWYTWWKNGRWEYTAKDNIVDLKPVGTAVDDGYTKATQEAAVAEQAAKDKVIIDQQAQVIADQKTEVVAAENYKAAHKAFLG